MIPTLQTQRLILRAPRQGDFDTFAAFFRQQKKRP